MSRITMIILVICLFSAPIANASIGDSKIYQSKDACMIALTQENLDKAGNAFVAENYAIIDKMVEAHKIFFLKPGVKVKVLQRDANHRVLIKVIGYDAKVWTYDNMISEFIGQ